MLPGTAIGSEDSLALVERGQIKLSLSGQIEIENPTGATLHDVLLPMVLCTGRLVITA